MNHYNWLNKNFNDFTNNLNLPNYQGLITAHGDKCYSYKDEWESHNIPFPHGVAIYLLTYVKPFSKEVRETNNGWVDPKQWVIDNYQKFKPLLCHDL